VAQELRKKGFTLARPLAGGFAAWRDAGMPVEERNERSAVSP
jgi:rhodanese-related sulfurtransferase